MHFYKPRAGSRNIHTALAGDFYFTNRESAAETYVAPFFSNTT